MSITKKSVESAGMLPLAWSPYPSTGGMTTPTWEPTFCPTIASEKPGIISLPSPTTTMRGPGV
jgi:hypothetical protein